MSRGAFRALPSRCTEHYCRGFVPTAFEVPIGALRLLERSRRSGLAEPRGVREPTVMQKHSPSWALAANSTRELTGHRQDAVSHLDGQHGETPGRRPIDDPGVIPRGELGRVAGAEEGLRLGLP